MSTLADIDIKRALQIGVIGIEPFEEAAIQPASVDLRLSPTFMRMPKPRWWQRLLKCEHVIDTRRTLSLVKTWEPTIIIRPGEFILASTAEKITLNDQIVARVEGKSSLGRLGLSVHVTAGFIDPGFSGFITLEMTNLSPLPIQLYSGMFICQIAFQGTLSTCEKPYQGKYTDQKTAEPVASRIGQVLPTAKDYCYRETGHDGPCNGLPRRNCPQLLSVYGMCTGCGVPEHLTGTVGKMFCSQCTKDNVTGVPL